MMKIPDDLPELPPELSELDPDTKVPLRVGDILAVRDATQKMKEGIVEMAQLLQGYTKHGTIAQVEEATMILQYLVEVIKEQSNGDKIIIEAQRRVNAATEKKAKIENDAKDMEGKFLAKDLEWMNKLGSDLPE